MTRKFIALMCLVSLHVTQAFAEDYKVGSLAIETPWTRATPNDAKVAAGYMKIVNSGKIDDHLVGGSTTIAGKVEIHEMSMVDNVMKMRQLPGGLDLKPGQSVELKPGSYHVMFIDLKRQLKPGEKFMAAALVLSVAAVIFYRGSATAPTRQMSLAASIGGPFDLLSYDNRRVSSKNLKGTPFAVFFGFTNCPDICPTTMLSLSNLMKRLGPDADNMRYFFISVDTERDTPEHLKLYLSSFDDRITA